MLVLSIHTFIKKIIKRVKSKKIVKTVFNAHFMELFTYEIFINPNNIVFVDKLDISETLKIMSSFHFTILWLLKCSF